MCKNLIDSSMQSGFSWERKNYCIWPYGPNRSNDSIFNESYAHINGFLGQKLIFSSIKSAQDVPYYPTNIEKKRDIRDQHILFYRSKKITNEMDEKKIFEYLRGILSYVKSYANFCECVVIRIIFFKLILDIFSLDFSFH